MSQIDENKFQEVFRHYYNPLCNFAASIVKDDRLAQDVVQDVFTNIWAKKESLRLEGNEKSYLFTAVKNKAIEILRKKANDKKVTEVMFQLQDKSIEAQADKFLLREYINKSLRQLPPKCKQIFELSKFNGLTYSEIAEELDISVKTVENQIGKAYRMLRELLSGRLEEIYT